MPSTVSSVVTIGRRTYDASLLLAAAMFANVVCTEGYQEQLKKAIAEYKTIKGGGTRIDTPAAEAGTRTAAIYDMNGRQLNAKTMASISRMARNTSPNDRVR